MKSWVDIAVPGRQGERHRLSESGTTVGAGSAADITIKGMPGLLPVHFHLRPGPEGCWAELIENAPEPFFYEGKPSRSRLVPWGQDIYLGALRLTLAWDGVAGRKGASPILWLGALAVVLLVGSFALRPEADAGTIRARVDKPPALFGEMPPCSEDEQGALGRAGVAEQMAHVKHERGVFELSDRVDSVQHMREAAACYALAGNQGASDQALGTVDEWSSELGFIYKRAQIDLEFGTRTSNPRRVLDAAKQIETLLAHGGAPAREYVERVSNIRRKQMAVIAAKQKKKKK